MTKLQTHLGTEEAALVGRSLKRRWRRQALGFVAALGMLALTSVTPALAATGQLVQISSDPYTNLTSNHKTESSRHSSTSSNRRHQRPMRRVSLAAELAALRRFYR